VARNVIENDATVRYELDPGSSDVTVQAFASGLLGGLGHNPTIRVPLFTGAVHCDPTTLRGASVKVVVPAESLFMTDDISEKDRTEIEQAMRDDVLECDRYPDIVFESVEVTPQRIAEGRFKIRIVGGITLHGITQSGLWLQVQVTVSPDTLRATGQFKLKQTDYGIKLVTALGGALKVKDELHMTFDIGARRAYG
jgi:polyisoprenoid-binding protein YceI